MKLLKSKKFLTGSMTSIMALIPTVICHAADDNITTSMTTAMNTVKTDTLSAISAVAPIGIGIMGAFLVWRYGIRFFKGISK